LLLLLLNSSVFAQSASIFQHQVSRPMDQVYGALYKALEDEGFYVVFEADIGKNLSRFAEKWGENYNRNQLDGIRSLVFCNGWYANAVSNADPAMLALCPLRLSLIEKKGMTTVLFARPTVIAAESPARQVLMRVENEVIDIVKKSVTEKK
ncbi:MAG: DUF302 domain-containing protein, partial [Gammaproteobacteria bacterium]|nr:DUF302 domain-containing protein [Gammaproteobacteria bacterium]